MENKVELLSHFGDDLMSINSARVSFGKSKDMLDEKDERLIKYLVEHKHTAPFRHPQLQFRITCPIYVERQLFKHQIGWSANSISGRYVDFSDSYTTIK
jgi:thymidylate synthase (FAD)